MTDRERFEAWISAPPYEKSIARFSEVDGWARQYVEIDVQLAWEAWRASSPSEPTDSMLNAATRVIQVEEGGVKRRTLREIYKAMRAAAAPENDND